MKRSTDGIDLQPAFEEAVIAAHNQGQLAPGLIERNLRVLFWAPEPRLLTPGQFPVIL